MAPSEGVIRDGAAAASPGVQPRLPPPDPSVGLLSCLKRLCLCGASAARRDTIAHHERQQDVSASRTPPTPRRLLQQPSRKSTSGGSVTEPAPSADLIDSQMGLNSSILISIRGGPIAREEDMTFSCMEPGHHPALDSAKATGTGAAAAGDQQQQAALLTTLTFAAAAQMQPLGSVGSQRLSPTALDLDAGAAAAAAAASLYQYSISSYAINAPSGAPASGANGQAPGAGPGQGARHSQPGTYIDLPTISGSPAPVSPLLLVPLAVRGLRPPPPVTAAAAAAGAAEGSAGADLAAVHASPQVPTEAQGTSGRALGIPVAAAAITDVAAQRLQVQVTAKVAVASPPPPSPPPLRLQQRPITPQALSEPPRPTRILQQHPPPSWSANGQGQGGQGHSLSEHPSAPLPSLRPPLQPTILPQGEIDLALMSLEGSSRAALLARQERPNRRHGSPPPGSASSFMSRSHGGGAPFDTAVAAATAPAAVASPFVGPPMAVGSRAASGAHQRQQNNSVSGVMAYGYGNGSGNGHVYGNGHGTGGGSGYGYLDDGRSAALWGQISGTLSPRLTSFQYGAVTSAAYGSAAMPYGPPPPSPPRSSVGLVVPSRVSVSGAGSVLSLPIETSSLLDVTAPRTGLLPEQTALEMSMQAPALDLWAAAALVAPTSRIAQGAYGVVYRGLWHGCTCAVKLMLAASTENLSSQLTEVFLCKALSCHPNIVQTFDCNVWRITPDTLQAVRSFCGGGGAFGGGGGSAVVDNSPLPTAAMLQSAASMWLGATPSMGLSAAPSGAPSASSNIGPYGLAAMAAFAPVSADMVAGALGESSSFAAPPFDATTAAALAMATAPTAAEVAARLGPTAAEASVVAVIGPWNGRDGVVVGLSNADADARRSGSAPFAPTATAGGAGVAAAVELAAATATTSVGHEQERPRPHLCSGSSKVVAEPEVQRHPPAPEADKGSLQPPFKALQPQPPSVGQNSAPLPLDSVRDVIPLELPSALGSQGCSSPPSPRPSLVGTVHLGVPVAEQPQQQQQQEQRACSATLVLSGVLPNLSPPVSLPASLPPSSQLLAAVSGVPSSTRSELPCTLQSQQQLGREQQWPRRPPSSQQGGGDSWRSAGGWGLQEKERQQEQQEQHVQQAKGAQEAVEPGPSPGQESHKQQQRQLLQEGPQRQQEPVQQGTDPESAAANPTGAGSLPGQLESGGVGAVRLSGGAPSASQVPRTYAPAPAAATARAPAWDFHGPMGAGKAASQLRQGPPSSAALPEQQSHNSSVCCAADGGDCSTGRAPTPSVVPAENATPPSAPAAAAAATTAHPSPLTFSAVGPAAPAPLAPAFAAASAAALVGTGPVGSRLASSNASHNFIDGRWPSPDASSRGPSPALVRSNSFSRHATGVAGGSAAAAAAVMAGCAGSAVAGVVPLSAMQAASMIGLGPAGLSTGLCSSPISSGMLPPSLLQPGSASGTSRQLPDRPFTLSVPGAAPMGAGGFGGGGGGSASVGGPGPLQGRSAVSMGDEGDAVAAMAGARSLAQVLNLLGARDGQLAVLVVMEECDRGSLQQLLSKAASAVAAAVGSGGVVGGSLRSLYLYAPFSGGGRYPPQAALRALAMTAREVALGMAFLHHHNIIHGDLKPGNVLLKSSRQDQRGFIVKISDFGLSRVLHNSGTPHHLLATEASGSGSDVGRGGVGQGRNGAGGDDGDVTGGALDGTVPYLAPELINNGQRSKASDVWAYGVLLWQLVTGMRPYDGLMQWQIMAAVCSGEQLLNWPLEAHPSLVHLGRGCLSFNPRDRPTFAQIVRRLMSLEGELRAEVGR